MTHDGCATPWPWSSPQALAAFESPPLHEPAVPQLISTCTHKQGNSASPVCTNQLELTTHSIAPKGNIKPRSHDHPAA
jgi:hypothetical protein